MIFPIALIITGTAYWPVTLALALVAAMLGAYLRGGWRLVCFIIAGILLVTLILVVPLLAEWQSAKSL